jgi:fructose-1-phosphate kinase PfkB-like protein
MNPALDVTATADVVRPTEKIRCVGTRYDPGGGGINVARRCGTILRHGREPADVDVLVD